MNGRSVGRLASACWWLATAISAGVEARPADLVPVPLPSLETLDAAERELLASRRASLDELVADGAAADKTVAAAFGEMGRIYLLEDLAGAAEACFANAAALRPDDYRWHYYLALLDERGGRLEDAVAHLERVVSLVPDDLAARLRLGRAVLAIGRPQKARREFSASLEISPNEDAAKLGLEAAEAALAGGSFDPPVLRFADPLLDGLTPLAERLRVDAGIDALERGDLALAVERLEAALADAPNDWRALYYLGVARFRGGEVEGAIASVRRALESAPDFGEGHFSLASALVSIGREAEARVHFERAYQADPKNSAVQMRWAQELAASGRRSEALPILRSLVRREPNDQRAVTLFGEVLTTEAGALARSGSFVAAAASFAEVARLHPDEPAPWFSQALALLLAGSDGDAREALEAGIAATSGERSLLHLLARVLATSRESAVRDGRRALDLARQVLAAESTIEHAETVAMALAEVGDFDEAVAWQEQIVANLGGPSSPRAAEAAARLALYRRAEPSRAPWAAGGDG
jgi:tetratricopeptide (TPR) repeat protein